jgi:hypothetical protein
MILTGNTSKHSKAAQHKHQTFRSGGKDGELASS